jgi:hypothetical protein
MTIEMLFHNIPSRNKDHVFLFFNFNKKNNIEKNKDSDIHTNYTRISQSEKEKREEICQIVGVYILI